MEDVSKKKILNLLWLNLGSSSVTMIDRFEFFPPGTIIYKKNKHGCSYG